MSAKVLGGMKKGLVFVVSAPAGTGKTSITAAFAKKICVDKISCLFCVFEETPNQLIRNMKSIGINFASLWVISTSIRTI